MNANTRALQDLGQRLWLDHISRDLLDSGTLARYIGELDISGLTSNPVLFERAIAHSHAYDASIRTLGQAGLSGERLFFALALEDLTRAADLFRPVFDASDGLDGWVSLEVSPLLADNTAHTIRAAAQLYEQAARPNLFIKIPGTPEGLRAVEELVFDGVPVNVTLLFSPEHCRQAKQAYWRGLERRLVAGLPLRVASVASVFVSRWDAAVTQPSLAPLRHRLGIAMATLAYAGHQQQQRSERWQALAAAGARPQRLLWASTGTKDPALADTWYVQALAAADTLNTLPEKTLLAWADHGQPGPALRAEVGEAEAVLEPFRREGVDLDALAARLQHEGVLAFADAWHALLASLRSHDV